MYILENDRLVVEVSKPGEYYKGIRFDWNGFITQVTLDGKHTFCVPESLKPGAGTGGCGICGEFGIDDPVGYDDTPVGGYFPKIGVGILKKSDMSDYFFAKTYESILHSSEVVAEKGSISFFISSSECNGYAYEYKKSISLSDNRLKISYLLNNTGVKKISTSEYCHNFFRINNEEVNSNYTLTLPCKIDPVRTDGEIILKDNVITWPDKEMEQQFYLRAYNFDNKTSASWELYNHKNSIGVREINDFPVGKFALWGYKHVISPEAFIMIELEPGQTKTWIREYEFFK